MKIVIKSYIQNIFCNITKNLFVPKIRKQIFLTAGGGAGAGAGAGGGGA